jgi:phosphate uptake regulator
MKFRTTIELGGTTATGFAVPVEIVDALGAGKRPPVQVRVGAVSYRSTIASMGGRFMIPLSADRRSVSGLAAGDEVDVDLELDTAPRIVDVPGDLATALAAEPGAREQFDALSYSPQKEHVRAVEDAKTQATRERRIAKAVTDLTT